MQKFLPKLLIFTFSLLAFAVLASTDIRACQLISVNPSVGEVGTDFYVQAASCTKSSYSGYYVNVKWDGGDFNRQLQSGTSGPATTYGVTLSGLGAGSYTITVYDSQTKEQFSNVTFTVTSESNTGNNSPP